MGSFFERHKKVICRGFLVLTGLLSFIGCYQYYTAYVDQVIPERLWSSVFYSALQLYLLSPTVDAGEATPICYELAKWTAPLCTAYWILKAAQSLFCHELGVLRKKLGRKRQLVVFGFHETSERFLEHLQKEKEKRQLILVAEENLDRESRLRLEKTGILVYEKDFCLRELSPDKTDHIVLFHKEAARNFALLQRLARQPDNPPCSVWCQDRTMKKIITDFGDSMAEERSWNLGVFDLPDIAASDLFRREPLYQNCLEQVRDSISLKEVLATIPQPHLLIAGFGSCGQAVFEKALLTGTLSDRSEAEGYEKLRITVMDRDTERCRDLIESRYPRIEKMCHVEYIQAEAGSVKTEKRLFDLPWITYAVICFSDETVSIRTMMQIRAWLGASETGNRPCAMEVPVAVRLKEHAEIARYQKRDGFSRVVLFGDCDRLLGSENVIRHETDREAKNFHRAYAQIQRQVKGQNGHGSGEELWNSLTWELKESCRAQVLNRPYFQELIRGCADPSRWETVLLSGDDTAGFLAKVPEDLELLAALEHRRWCSFCYCTGYAGYDGRKEEKRRLHMILEDGKRYYGKVHNCLIDDWEAVKKDKTAGETVIYDVCSVCGYEKEKDKDKGEKLWDTQRSER